MGYRRTVQSSLFSCLTHVPARRYIGFDWNWPRSVARERRCWIARATSLIELGRKMRCRRTVQSSLLSCPTHVPASRCIGVDWTWLDQVHASGGVGALGATSVIELGRKMWGAGRWDAAGLSSLPYFPAPPMFLPADTSALIGIGRDRVHLSGGAGSLGGRL